MLRVRLAFKGNKRKQLIRLRNVLSRIIANDVKETNKANQEGRPAVTLIGTAAMRTKAESLLGHVESQLAKKVSRQLTIADIDEVV